MGKEKYPLLFSPLKIRNTVFRNRIMATPTSLTWPDPYSGAPEDMSVFFYEDKARGGAASVTLSETTISRHRGASRGVGFYVTPDPVYGDPRPALAKVADGIRRHGAVASVQIHHAGDVTMPSLIGGENPVGPNNWTRPDGVKVTALDEDMMHLIANDFAETALAAKGVGFNMVQVHGAHGWLLGQFQSGATNWRTDKYGGSVENRARFPLMVVKAIREKVGDMIIEYRMSGDEHLEGGIQADEAAEFAAIIQDYVDIIHVSAGSYYTARQYTFPGPYQPLDTNTHLAAAVKKKVHIPVSTVGAHFHPAVMEQILAEGKADFIAMGRQLLADPQFPNKLMDNEESDIRPCIRCNNCLGRKYESLNNCDVNPLAGNEMYTLRTPDVKVQRKVLVIGGGPGGMQAAITASQRGHDVVLCEKENKLGGMLDFSGDDKYKEDLHRYTQYLMNQVKKSAVDLRLNTAVDVEYIEKEAPYAVICAIGAQPIQPTFDGMENLPTLSSMEAYKDPDSIDGDNVVIVGGGLVGCELAIFLAEDKGKNVSVVEMKDILAEDANIIHRDSMMEAFENPENAITAYTGFKCLEFSKEGVVVENAQGTQTLPADSVIFAVGTTSRTDQLLELQKAEGVNRFMPIGDVLQPTRVKDAVHNGYYAAMDII